MPNSVRFHRVLRATPERVYRAFLDPDAMVKWLPPNGFTGRVHHVDATAGFDARHHARGELVEHIGQRLLGEVVRPGFDVDHAVARLDRHLERIAAREAELNAEIAAHAQDYEKLAELSARLDELAAEKDEVELEWLAAAEVLE